VAVLTTLPLVTVVTFAVAAAGCATDLRSRRIPNWLTGSATLAALLYHLWTGGPSGLLFAAGGCLVGGAIFLLPFALGGLGGGDVKLLAALGAWAGPAGALWIALYSGVAGGLLAIGVALATGYFKTAWTNVSRLLVHWGQVGITPLPDLTLERSAAPKLAYALPILCGTVVTLWQR
jgi:prepilin peptidase CpaA